MWLWRICFFFFFFNDTATTEIYTLSLHDALPIRRGPGAAGRELERLERLGPHLDRVSRRRGRHVAAVLDPHGVEEVLVQVVHVLQDAVLQRGANSYVVEDREVLDVLAQAHAARVRADRDSELGGQKQHRDDLVHAAQAAGIYLAEADSVGLHEL